MGTRSEAVVMIGEDPRVNVHVNLADWQNFPLEYVRNLIHELTGAVYPQAVPAPSPETDQFGTHLHMLNHLGPSWDINSMENHYMREIHPLTPLAMRMKWGVFDKTVHGIGDAVRQVPFDHISIHESTSKVFVFVVLDGKATTIEDEAAMFPSDTLVTQLRMLADKVPVAM